MYLTYKILTGNPCFSGFDGFDVRKIDDIEYTVEISCYFLTKWRDDRLMLHEDIMATAAEGGDPDEEQWFPIDLEFVNKVRIKDVGIARSFDYKSSI